MSLSWFGGIERWIPGRISQVKGPRTYLVHCGSQIRFVHVDHLKGTVWNPSWGSVAGSIKNSRAELVESQAAAKDCLVLPEPLPIEFSTSSPENSVVAENVEEQLVPEETQDSVLGDILRRTSTPGLSLSPPSVPRYPLRERKATSRLICEIEFDI